MGIAWTELGPSNIGGRVNTILTNPANAQQLLVGTAGGGLWQSDNGGASWSSVSDALGSLAISTLARGPGGTLYAGTGDLFDPARGVGILASTDGGNTWSVLSSTNPSVNKDWYYVNHIAVNSVGVMLVATGAPSASNWGAIYRSTDGGQTFTQVQSGASLDVAFDPNNGNDVVAEFEDGTVRYSTDGGQTWSAPVTVVAGGGRITLAFAHDTSHAGWVYASVDNSPSAAPSGQIYLSKDDGQAWALLSSPGQLCSGSECQGWYDNILWVDPTDATHLVTGGINLFQSTDGGSAWTPISKWWNAPISPHADQHAIASDPGYNGTTDKQIYIGNDGGMYGATDITAVTSTSGWTELNTGLAMTQFYSVSGHAGDTASANGNIVPIIAGAQDNGTEIRAAGASNTNWAVFYGGDGGYTDVDPGNANYLYGEYVYLYLFQSTDGGQSANGFTNEPPDTSAGKANFIAPFLLDPSNSNAMFAGGQQLWYGTSLQTNASWRSLSGTTLPQNSNDFINTIGVDPSNDKDIWVGFDGGGIYHSTTATATTPTWQPMSTGAVSGARPTAIYVMPGSPQTVYISYWAWQSGNIFETTDGGATWQTLGQTLPPVPVNDVTTDPSNSQIVYAATEIGLFVSMDGGQTWTTSNQGPGNVAITQLRWFDLQTPELLVSTYGRGAWEGRPGNLTLMLNSISPTRATVGSPGLTLDVVGLQFATNATVDWNGTALPTTYVSATELKANVSTGDLSSSGTFNITVVNPAPGGGTSNAEVFTVNNPVPTLTSLSPSSVAVGSNALTITLTGTGFMSASVIQWAGAALATTYVSATKLTASVPTSDLTTIGTFNVTVVNPAPGGAASNAVVFTVSNPAPTLTSLSPSSAVAGSNALTVMLSGTGFVPASTAKWTGTALKITYVSATQLKASVPASDLSTAGTFNVTVVNAAPGGGTSSVVTFTVSSSGGGSGGGGGGFGYLGLAALGMLWMLSLVGRSRRRMLWPTGRTD